MYLSIEDHMIFDLIINKSLFKITCSLSKAKCIKKSMKEIARINKNNTINATVISLKKSSFYSLELS